MLNRMNQLVRAAVIGLIAALFMSCAGTQPTGGPQSSGSVSSSSGGAGQSVTKRFSAVMRGVPFTLSEAINAAGAGSVPGVDVLQDLIHAGLAIEDSNTALVARLAQEMPTIENGLWRVMPDGRMEMTWKLRPNVVWHDGAPFTTDDLIFSAAVAQDKRVALAGGDPYSQIEGIEVVDPLTIKVGWKRTYINADALFTRSGDSRILPMPVHLLGKAYEADASTFSQAPYWTTEFVGLGPFKVRDYVEASHMVLTANDRYFLGKPNVSEIEVKFMTEPSAIAANIMAGAAQFTLGGRYSLEWGIQVRDQWPSGRLDALVSTSWVAAFPQFLNPSPAILGEAQFRRALLHAIDRQEMSDTIQSGLSPIGHSIIPPNAPEYKDVESSIVRFDYDPRRAAQLIEGLGYARASDGFYRDGSGQRLSVEIRTRQGDDLQEKTMFGIAEYWQRAGVGVEQMVFPPQRANDLEFRSVRPAFEVVRQPSGTDGLTRYYGRDTPLPENGFRGINRTRYRNAEFDALLDSYVSTIQRRERNAVVAQIVGQMTSLVNPAGIYWALDPILISNNLVKVGGVNPAWNAHEWDVK